MILGSALIVWCVAIAQYDPFLQGGQNGAYGGGSPMSAYGGGMFGSSSALGPQYGLHIGQYSSSSRMSQPYGISSYGGANTRSSYMSPTGIGGRGATAGGVANMPTYMKAGGAVGTTGAAALALRGKAIRGGAGATSATAAAASKYDLLAGSSAGSGTSPTAGLPATLTRRLASGPLTLEEARALVAGVVGDSPPASTDAAAIADHGSTLFGQQAADPDLSALQTSLDTGDGSQAGSVPGPIDGDSLRRWFHRLDVSSDEVISFLEWRDGTGLGLDLFRRIDTSGEGQVDFEEFARALITNGAKSGRAIDDRVLDLGGKPAAASAASGLPVPGSDPMTDAALLDLARADLMHAALRERAKAGPVKAPPAAKPATPSAKTDAAKAVGMTGLMKSGTSGAHLDPAAHTIPTGTAAQRAAARKARITELGGTGSITPAAPAPTTPPIVPPAGPPAPASPAPTGNGGSGGGGN